MRCAIYIRTSPSYPEPASRLEALRAFAAEMGWSTEAFIDHGYNGSHDRWLKLRRAVQRGKFDVVLTTRLLEVAGSLRRLHETLEAFEGVGVRFVALDDKLDSVTPRGRVCLQLLRTLRAFERSAASESSKANVEAMKRAGLPIGRPRKRREEAA